MLYCKQSFSRFGTHFDDRSKILTYREIPPNIFYLRLSYENKRKSMVKYNICSSLDLENRLWVIIFTQERVPRQAFTYLKSTIETLKKWKLFKVNNKTPERLSTLLIVNFGHNSLFFLVPCRWIWTNKCLLRLTLSIYKRWNNILPQLFTDVQKS